MHANTVSCKIVRSLVLRLLRVFCAGPSAAVSFGWTALLFVLFVRSWAILGDHRGSACCDSGSGGGRTLGGSSTAPLGAILGFCANAPLEITLGACVV